MAEEAVPSVSVFLIALEDDALAVEELAVAGAGVGPEALDAEVDLGRVDGEVADFLVADGVAVEVDPDGIAIDDFGDGGVGDRDVEVVVEGEGEIEPNGGRGG